MACQATDKDWEVKYKQAGQFSNPGSPALPPRQSTTGIPEPHWGVLGHQATDEDSGGRFSSPASRATLPGLPTADALERLWAALRHQATDKDWEVEYKQAGKYTNPGVDDSPTPTPKPSPPPATTN
ncbi:hypothetical protein CEP51_009022 [Fusarium floridanum]|uniref:Uncharacterized protein n=1 Tax=Fusarium floridanum TaxID=1325733 RepID=A0A428RIY4_9HYPO|nr:hypothetical protein CEP51_009022 [Fusarium floridanum]